MGPDGAFVRLIRMDLPTDPHGLILRKETAGTHISDEQLQHMVGNKTLVRLWPGALADFTAVSELQAVEKHRLTVIAAARAGRPGRIFSHTSSAAMHRLPMLWPDLSQVHVTSPKVGKRAKHIVRHQATVKPQDIDVIDGVTVTSIERTACDVARLGTNRQALEVLDAALRRDADPDRMRQILDSCRGFKGVEMLRRALAHANASSESIGESLSRAVMLEFPDLPIPRQQVKIFDDHGVFIARVDFLLANRVIGEFDGMIKYSGGLGDEPAWQTVVEEKAREDRLRAQGYTVVRWTWPDLADKARFYAQIKKALRLGGVE